MSLSRFMASYLFAFLFWWGLSLGSLFILMLQRLTGGRWGELLRPTLEAASRTLPVLAIGLVPVLLGMGTLYPWAQSGARIHQAAYLNPAFFTARSLLYFVLWIALAWRLTRKAPQNLAPLSAVGLLVVLFSVTFASIDWMMSLEPAWASSIYGFLIVMGQLLSGLAFAVTVHCWRSAREPDVLPSDRPARLNDMGNLLLTAVLSWAYLAFMQVLIIWMGDLPHETPWVLARTAGAWRWVAVGLAVFQFALPAGLLLFRPLKRQVTTLGAIAFGLLLTHLIEVYWLVLPAFFPQGPRPGAWDLVLPLVLGGAWLWAFGHQLRRRPAAGASSREGREHG